MTTIYSREETDQRIADAVKPLAEAIAALQQAPTDSAAPQPPPAPAPTPAVHSEVVEEIIRQQQRHEFKPYAGRAPNDDGKSGWKNIPWKVVPSSRFNLQGATLMPPWGTFDKRSWLIQQIWNRASAWNQIFHLADPANMFRSLHRASGVGLALFDLGCLLWHGDNIWSRPFGPDRRQPLWMGSFWYDFRANASNPAPPLKTDAEGRMIVMPSDNGQGVYHGGNPGAIDIANWQTVRGVAVRCGCVLVNYNGSPLTDEQEDASYIGLSVGYDAQPPGTSVAKDFMPAAYIPGVGCGGFIRARREPRYAYFTTLEAAEVRANPPPF